MRPYRYINKIDSVCYYELQNSFLLIESYTAYTTHVCCALWTFSVEFHFEYNSVLS